MDLKDFKKIPLGFFPTPLIELPRLSQSLGGPAIFMKRDDQTGLALGGNKIRKLEYLLADALAKGCDTIITAGAEQSNHCRQTAAAAAKLGLDCHLVLGGKEPVKHAGNLLLDKILGCHIHWTGDNRKGEDLPRIFEQLQASRKKPYLVPYGGSNELGVISFVAAFKEMTAQYKGPEFTHIVFPSSSGGTHAGLILGKHLFEKSCHIIGINIDKDESGAKPFAQQILDLAICTAEQLAIDHEFVSQGLNLNSAYLGDGYGIVGDLENEAISLTARTEGILLDPVYTGRAMGGLIDMVRSGEINKDARVLFWHTGGIPALFAYADKLNFK